MNMQTLSVGVLNFTEKLLPEFLQKVDEKTCKVNEALCFIVDRTFNTNKWDRVFSGMHAIADKIDKQVSRLNEEACNVAGESFDIDEICDTVTKKVSNAGTILVEKSTDLIKETAETIAVIPVALASAAVVTAVVVGSGAIFVGTAMVGGAVVVGTVLVGGAIAAGAVVVGGAIAVSAVAVGVGTVALPILIPVWAVQTILSV